MAQVRKLGACGFAVITAIFSIGIAAETGDPATLIQERLASQIKLTKATADRSDIVTAGDVVVLQKDGLMMCSSDSSYAFSNTYNNGVLAANQNNRAKDAAKSIFKGHFPGTSGAAADAANNACPQRKFVAGEKFWITAISLQKGGILVSTLSDPYNDVRYYGEIKFPFPKGAVPSPDDFAKTVSDVIAVQGSGDQGGQMAELPKSRQQAKQPAPAPMPDIAPPPPPPDAAPTPPADAAPPTIAIGQTKTQVTGAFGQPIRVAKLGVKEIFYYKDMKVTFSNGKVSNVE